MATDIFSDDSKYIASVRKAVCDAQFFNVFKRDEHYRGILEHVSEAVGQKYLNIIKQEAPDFLERIEEFKINDKCGDPILYNYSGVGAISPTTLRYIKVASDLRGLFGDLSGFTIAEVGVGYGGQMLILDQIWETFYCLFDLPPVLELVHRYILGSDYVSILRQTTLSTSNEFDLVISNYAFSELSASIQEDYIAKVLSKSKRGYLTMNYINGFSLDELRNRLPRFNVFQENPLTSLKNNIIVWGL